MLLASLVQPVYPPFFGPFWQVSLQDGARDGWKLAVDGAGNRHRPRSLTATQPQPKFVFGAPKGGSKVLQGGCVFLGRSYELGTEMVQLLETD